MAEELSGKSKLVDRYLESRLHSADAAESLAIDAARQVGFSEEDQHRIGMAVRESVVNAVVHGNRYNARKKVHLEIVSEPDRLTVTVSDEGEGFDPASLPDPLSAENLLHQSGRGILLIRTFVDEFQVRRLVPKGTEVRLVKYAARR